MTTNEVFPRPLTHTEEALLRFMLGVAGDDVEPLRARVADLWVTGLCPCGCPTVLLAPHGDLHDPEAEALFTETVTKPGAFAIPHELLLFVHPTGWPSSLELVTYMATPRRPSSHRWKSSIHRSATTVQVAMLLASDQEPPSRRSRGI